jgi:C-terminal processing protease CtpA/Prc
MNRILAGFLLALFPALGLQTGTPPLQATDWVAGDTIGGFTMEANGRATDSGGATVLLRSSNGTSGAFGSATSTLTADALRGRRVTIAGEIQTRGAGGASLWLRVDRDATQLMLDNGADQTVRGDRDWARQSISLPVPPEATAVFFGVLLQGSGTVSVRALRVEVSAPLSSDAPLAPAAKDVLEVAIATTKENSLHRAEVPWDVVEPTVRALAAGADKTSDVYPAIRFLLGQLGDHHSSLMPPAQASAFQAGGAQNAPPDVRSLADGIGYISIPGYLGVDRNAMQGYAARLHQSIGSSMTSAACGWVIDLRLDTGGNMWPMLAGLKPFLGTTGLGTFHSPAGSGQPWVAGQGVDVDPPPALAGLETAWVAVLTGPRTASSGEAVTIAFRGRLRTRSFGLPTAGLSTANGTFPLPDGAMMLLTTAVDADRTGRLYGDKIDPDQRVEASVATGRDNTLSMAIEWLKQASGCR